MRPRRPARLGGEAGAASGVGGRGRRRLAVRQRFDVGLVALFPASGAGRGFEVVGALPFGEDGGVVAVLVAEDDVETLERFAQFGVRGVTP